MARIGTLGQLVRKTWVNWAKQQPNAKPSWLTPWDDLDPGQKEVDQLIGEAVEAQVARKYIARIKQLEFRCANQATIINALNRTIGQLLNHIGQYSEASRAVLDGYQTLFTGLLHNFEDLDIVKAMEATLIHLKQVASTKQAVDMGPYEAVDFTRLASSYIDLREKAQVILNAINRINRYNVKHSLVNEDLNEIQEHVDQLEECLKQYPTPDYTPLAYTMRNVADTELEQLIKEWQAAPVQIAPATYPVQITTVTITPHVKELVAMLKPDTAVEAIIYEKGKAVITTVSAKLAALTEAVRELLMYGSFHSGTIRGNKAYNRLCYLMSLLTAPMAPKDVASDPVGYTTLKLKVLQVAAKELLNAWKVNGDTGDYARLVQAVGRLAEALEKAGEERRT